MSTLLRNVSFKGKGRIVARIRSEATGNEVLATCNGVRYRLDLRDDVQRELYFNSYEQRDLRHALELIPCGGVCLDVGANNGAFALQFAKKVGPGGLVHAFEPDAANFSRLSSNSRMNGFEDVLKCHQMAVSNVTGSLSFYRSEPNHSGWGSLEEFNDIAVEKETVPSITLDDFLADKTFQRVDLLKVDVEAHEPELLEGARKSLLAHAFRFILIEFNGARLTQRGKFLNDFLQPLLSAGYAPAKLRLQVLEGMRKGSVPVETVCANFLFAPSK